MKNRKIISREYKLVLKTENFAVPELGIPKKHRNSGKLSEMQWTL
jgi:hypothetical protein